jgi:hypothetical protein
MAVTIQVKPQFLAEMERKKPRLFYRVNQKIINEKGIKTKGKPIPTFKLKPLRGYFYFANPL